jgi:RNA-directed DNA polymerase
MIIERMAEQLALPPRFIDNIAHGASHEYKTYLIPKRTGGSRRIFHPSRRLKAMQRWLLRNVLASLPVHNAATAFRPGRSTRHNAEPHAKSKFLLRLDLTDFFPSIKQTDVTNYIASHPRFFRGWGPQDVDVFCGIVCREGVLTIGAPTSPALSNALCYDLDAQMETLCSANGIEYTRYADDLFLSSKEKGVLRGMEGRIQPLLDGLSVPRGLRLNASKTRHSSKRGRRRITGIVLGSDENLHVGRSLKRRVRALIHRYDSLTPKARVALAGSVAYAIGLDPDFANSLIQKYGLKRVREARGITT